MPDILIRNVDPLVVEKLKKRAKMLGTSLQAEAKKAVERSVKLTREEAIERMRQSRERTAGLPQSDSTEIIRRMRDACNDV